MKTALPGILQKFDFKKLNRREQGVVAVAFLVVLGFGYYQLEYQPQQKKLEVLEAKLTSVNSSIAAFQKVVSEQKGVTAVAVREIEQKNLRLKEEVSQLREEIEKIKFRAEGGYVTVLNQIQDLAGKYGIFLNHINVLEEDGILEELGFRRVILNLNFYSNYPAIQKFLGALETLPAPLSIQSLETERNEEVSPKIETRLTLKLKLFIL